MFKVFNSLPLLQFCTGKYWLEVYFFSALKTRFPQEKLSTGFVTGFPTEHFCYIYTTKTVIGCIGWGSQSHHFQICGLVFLQAKMESNLNFRVKTIAYSTHRDFLITIQATLMIPWNKPLSRTKCFNDLSCNCTVKYISLDFQIQRLSLAR